MRDDEIDLTHGNQHIAPQVTITLLRDPSKGIDRQCRTTDSVYMPEIPRDAPERIARQQYRRFMDRAAQLVHDATLASPTMISQVRLPNLDGGYDTVQNKAGIIITAVPTTR
jgi:hypothetical protein